MSRLEEYEDDIRYLVSTLRFTHQMVADYLKTLPEFAQDPVRRKCACAAQGADVNWIRTQN